MIDEEFFNQIEKLYEGEPTLPHASLYITALKLKIEDLENDNSFIEAWESSEDRTLILTLGRYVAELLAKIESLEEKLNQQESKN